MKKTLIILVFFTLFFHFSFPVYGENEYKDIYEYSGIDDVQDELDENTRSFFDDQNIDITNYSWVDNLKTEGIISHIWAFAKSGAKTPIKSGFAVLSIILIAAAFKFYRSDRSLDAVIKFALSLSVMACLFSGVFSSIKAAVNVTKGSASFMMSFVPVYMGVLSASGAPTTAASGGGMLLLSAEFVAAAAAFGQSAIIGAYLALSISSSVSPIMNKSGFADTFKRTGLWIMSLLSTVFLGVLGAKNAINSAADSVTVRTAKYILGTCVPVAGTALSGAVNTVSASMSVLKSSVGIYGVVALAVMFLPIILELLIWRLVLSATSGICSVFDIDQTGKLLKAIDGIFSILVGTLLMVGATFIISLASVVSASRGI